jgi:hypothetical protein
MIITKVEQLQEYLSGTFNKHKKIVMGLLGVDTFSMKHKYELETYISSILSNKLDLKEIFSLAANFLIDKKVAIQVIGKNHPKTSFVGGDSGGPIFDNQLYLYGIVRDTVAKNKDYGVPIYIIKKFVHKNLKNKPLRKINAHDPMEKGKIRARLSHLKSTK